jgi:hypothetical protein
VILLPPDGIHDVQTKALLILALRPLASGGELLIHVVERRMQAVCGQVELHRPRHLMCRIASRSCVGHGQCHGDAIRREEEIVRALSDLPIEIEREHVVAIDQFCQFIRRQGSRRLPRFVRPYLIGRRRRRTPNQADDECHR